MEGVVFLALVTFLAICSFGLRGIRAPLFAINLQALLVYVDDKVEHI